MVEAGFAPVGLGMEPQGDVGDYYPASISVLKSKMAICGLTIPTNRDFPFSLG